MAQRVKVMLVCDLHEEETSGTETVTFSLDGAAYELDLCDEHSRGFREALGPYVGMARRAGGGGRSARPGRASRQARRGHDGERRNSGDVREWARAQGIEISARGRIPSSVMERYAAAH
jgi:hypothetical protein